MSRGSVIELRWMMGGRTPGFKRVRDQIKDRDWEFVGFTEKTFVLRIERENVEYDRYKGTIKQRVSLGEKKSW